LTLREKEIANCMGCFGCWVRTPGKCVRKDFGQDVARAVINSDLLVLVGRVTFGGYSSELKKAIDRFIPLITPFFGKVDGEVHHKPRYDKYPMWVNIGIVSSGDEECKETFRRLLNRNAINFFSRAHTTAFIYTNDDEAKIRDTIRGTLKDVVDRKS